MSESKQKGKSTVPSGDDNKVRAVDPAPTDAEPRATSDKPSADTTKKTIQGKNATEGPSGGKPSVAKMTMKEAKTLLEMNPALKSEMAGLDGDKAVEAMQKMSIADLLTGLSVSGKNQKDMASYKFWQTQPVTRFDEQSQVAEDGPIKIIDPTKVSKEPDTLLDGFEWTTLDLTDEKELRELWDLLTYHYVEDDDAMFRFRYSESFLHWCVSLRVFPLIISDIRWLQGSHVSRLAKAMARRCSCQQVSQTRCFHHRCSHGAQRARSTAEGHRDQLSLYPQETTV